MVGRYRSFVAVFYPESAPENFLDLIGGWNVPALLVLHDKDKLPDGEDKKSHYHLLLMFGGKKSLNQVHELVDQLGSKRVQPAYDVRGSARYLAHLDDPDKYQYGIEALESFAGASALELAAPVGDPSPEIIAWVRDQGIVEYSKLIDYCLDERLDWYGWASSHSIFLCHYLQSCRGWKRECSEVSAAE